MSCSISLCMIAKNEEHQIARCIKSAKPFVDQIVVVDTGSTDNTVQIARELGTEVHQIQWQDDFSHARNKSLEYATGDWIMFLDCDEELDPDTASELKKVYRMKNMMATGYILLTFTTTSPAVTFYPLGYLEIIPSFVLNVEFMNKYYLHSYAILLPKGLGTLMLRYTTMAMKTAKLLTRIKQNAI